MISDFGLGTAERQRYWNHFDYLWWKRCVKSLIFTSGFSSDNPKSKIQNSK
jgi:hypothetical protein